VKEALLPFFTGQERPGLVFVSCHGRGLGPTAPEQRAEQGALLCGNWPGKEEPTPQQRIAGSDIPTDADLTGMVAILMACYSAGTPVLDNFPGTRSRPMEWPVLAPAPFVARLPQELLARGALAVIGHVDRGWTLSAKWHYKGRGIGHTGSMKDTLTRMLHRLTVGSALGALSARYTQIAALLAFSTDKLRNGEEVDAETIGLQWTAHNDARNLILLGDPAVCLLGKRRKGLHEKLLRKKEELSSLIALDPKVIDYIKKQAGAIGQEPEEWLNQLLKAREAQEEAA